MNQCHFSGNLAAAPEVRYLQSGRAVASLRLAVSRSWKDGDEWKKETCWLDCVAWGKMAESAADMPKGLGLVVTGYMKTEEWETEGKKRSRLVLVIQEGHRLAPRTGQDSESAPAAASTPPRAPRPASAAPRAPSETIDDIPF